MNISPQTLQSIGMRTQFPSAAYAAAASDLAVPDNVNLDELNFRNEKNDLQRVQDWVEKYDGMNGRFRFFQAYMPLSPLYQCVGKPLLSMKASGSMDVERAAKPFKHLILQKDRNSLSDAKGVKLFRSQQNLKHL